ncbi:MAG TPA: hypothetical protein VNO30_02465 [Kofleriaceae bacterium]|nr:hypothetical protein [Kofleriaceae bacterium]
MRRNLGKVLALALLLMACGPTRRDPDSGPDGGGGGGGDGGNGGDDDGPPAGDGCPDEAKLIYAVDQNRKLLQFNPMTKTFNDLGTLPCQPSSSATPFSMGIARDATAWVLYNNGELFRVETKNNLACTKSAWVPNTNGLKVFGMGFSTDQVGGQADSLFIAGGSGPSTGGSSTLARVNLTTFQATNVRTVAGWPELTGTGNAELWGFFPQTTTMSARIGKLDKTTGSEVQMFPETVLNDSSQPSAWAFAFHGGSFWVFLQKSNEQQTYVYQFSTATGAMVGKTDSGGRKIVGAGVSTCAPIIL